MQISYFSNEIDKNIKSLGKDCPRSIILDYETAWAIKSDVILLRKLREIKWKLDKLIGQEFNPVEE